MYTKWITISRLDCSLVWSSETTTAATHISEQFDNTYLLRTLLIFLQCPQQQSVISELLYKSNRQLKVTAGRFDGPSSVLSCYWPQYRHLLVFGGIYIYLVSNQLIILQGSVNDTAMDILGGVRSTCTYTGAVKLKELPKRTTFIR